MAAEITFSSILGLLLGIIFAGTQIEPKAIAIAGLALAFSFFLLKREILKYVVCGIFLCFAGFFYVHLFKNVEYANFPPIGEKASFEAVLTSEPVISGINQTAYADILAPYAGKISIATDSSRILKYGDRIKATGAFYLQSEFSYPSVRLYDFIVTAQNRGNWLKSRLIDFKNLALAKTKEFLSPSNSALMGGLIFGDSNNFSDSFKTAMKGSGTTHIVALSGYNITILIVAVGALLGNRFGRKVKFSLMLLAIVLFVIMVGATASVVRAAIMGSLLLLAKEMGRESAPRYAIVFTAGIMAVIDPFIVFNVGFELSFVSLLGIVYILPSLKNMLHIKTAKEPLETILMTLSAQAAVLPLTITYFGGFSLSSLLSNALILPFMPLAMGLGFCMVVAGFIFSPIAFVIGFAGNIMMSYFIFIIRLFAELRIPFGDFLSSSTLIFAYCFSLIFLIYSKYDAKI